MRFDMRAVEGHSFRPLSRFGRRFKDALPNSVRTPAVEAIIDRLGRPIFRRTVDPTTSGLEHMHDSTQNAHDSSSASCHGGYGHKACPIPLSVPRSTQKK